MSEPVDFEEHGETKPVCDCNGQGVQFRGRGMDLQHRYCPAIDEPDHVPTRAEAQQRVRVVRHNHRPSGRFG